MMESLPDMRARDREGLARIFRYFGKVETPRLDSRVYTIYSLAVAEDAEMLELASRIDPGQPPPNVLYAAVQDLLFENSTGSPEAQALSLFYPAISGDAIPDRSPWEAFRTFCLGHAEQLEPALRAGRTQICVVHRCAVVLPALASLPAIAAAGGRVALLEIGPSAGLNLRLDRYRYDYGGGVVWGDEGARPELFCDARGTQKPPVPGVLEVVYQIPREGRRAMVEGIERASRERPVDLLVMESTGRGDSRIDWTHFEAGARSARAPLAHSDPHGRWIEWALDEAVGRSRPRTCGGSANRSRIAQDPLAIA